ncbi:hypothetical protein PLICRDRAFT_41875 [Plicaturopsis crispa FD-325 SS-3]|nr:hypothetical protein PLICRDRAFT_41875 [Plicaturopsis crispa FD-325 SS-3]
MPRYTHPYAAANFGYWRVNRQATTLAPPNRSGRVAELMRLVFYLWMYSLSILLSILGNLSSFLFRALCVVMRLRPCIVTDAQESAILVIGADHGIGKDITMKLSELGYTVFAICPDKHAANSVAFETSSDVSSLLYSWHIQKGRFPNRPWGLVAPISLDISSKSHRQHAYETIKAYCSDHLLHLAALVVLPPTPDDMPSRTASQRHAATSSTDLGLSESRNYLPVFLAKDSAWKSLVTREVTEPVLLLRDYIKLLRKSAGRIIMVSGCSDSSITGIDLCSPMDEARRSIARTMNFELEPFGIKVVSVVAGPLDFKRASFDLDRRNVCAKRTDVEILHSIGRISERRRHWQSVFASLSGSEEEVFSVIKRILQSRYPRFEYIIGMHARLRCLLSAAPSSVQLLVHSLF